MTSAAKESKNFVGVDPEYAVYTNDVDKPLSVTAKESESNEETDKEQDGDVAESEADKSETSESKTDGAKTASRQTKK